MLRRRTNFEVSLAPLALLLPLLTSCGSRTPLHVDDPDACREAGASRVCENACGPGSQSCIDDHWEPCQVAPVTRACSDDCGGGTESCTEGTWTTCDVPVATRECVSLCGSGTETCVGGRWQNCNAPQPGPPKLKTTVRDFKDTHSDFERTLGGGQLDLGMVERMLGADDKPVYAGMPNTPSTSGKAQFDQWYRDIPGVNLRTAITIELTASRRDANIFVYDDDTFFPIDDQLFGNQGRSHNFHFTLELGTTFRYRGGETFRFDGDDDIWVFINRRLAIDLGGLHAKMGASVSLDAKAVELGLEKGGVYPLHLFFAERKTTASTFHIETTIAEFACGNE